MPLVELGKENKQEASEVACKGGNQKPKACVSAAEEARDGGKHQQLHVAQ